MVKTIMLKGTPLRMEKRNALLAKLKGEVVQAHDKVLKLKGVLPKGMMSFVNYSLCYNA